MARMIRFALGMVLSGSVWAGIGDACKTDAHCGPAEQCMTEFNQGYCAKFGCSEKNLCDANSKCLLIQPENFTICLKTCRQNTDCRTGYRCYDKGVCLP